MDNRLKQRLIGAAVLVALAVIILPELMKGPPEQDPPAVGTEVPPRPEDGPGDRPMVISLPPAEEPAAPAPSSAEQAAIPEASRTPQTVDLSGAPRAPAAVDRPAQSSEAPAAASRSRTPPAVATAPPARPPEPVAAPRPAAPTQSPETLKAVAPFKPSQPSEPVVLPQIELIGRAGTAPAVSDPVLPVPAPSTPRPAASSGVGWVVQVGSFSQEENAASLSDRLRAQRFPAVVARTSVDGRTVYRVRVGPQASRAESEQVLARLQREAGVSGQVMAQDSR